MAKLSEKAKVILLETTVLTNDTAAVKALFEQHQSFEFTARTLGLALRFCGAEMVRTLLENGATFGYMATPAFKTKYDCSVAISNSYSFAVNYSQYIFPAYDVKDDTHEILAETERTASLRILHEYQACNLEELLYLAIYYQDDAVYTELQTLGITKIPENRKNILSGELPYARLDSYDRYDRGRFQYQMSVSSDIKMKTMLERAISAMNIETIRFFPSDFYAYDFGVYKDKFISRYCSHVLFDFFLKKTNMTERVKKKEMLYALIDQDNAEGLAYVLKEKWVEKESEINELHQYAREKENVSPALLAVLMNEIQKTAPIDIDKEFSLTVSAADLKKLWSTKKQEDGTLIITSYKGTEKDVVIPDKIGKTAVTAIENDAFNPEVPRLTEMQRKARQELNSVIFPETITRIPERLFGNHSALTSVILGENTREIGRNAFYACTALEEITLPESITVIESYAFARCINLKKINLPRNLTVLPLSVFGQTGFETFEIPEQITEIGNQLFSECKKLKSLTLPKHITKIPNGIVSYCSNLKKITIPESVTEIGDFAFCGSGLKECIIPESVRTIGRGAFQVCKSLAKLELPAHTVLADEAFFGCDLLANEDGEIILNGTFFGFQGEQQRSNNMEYMLKPFILNDRFTHMARRCTDLPTIICKAHTEEGETLDISSLSVGSTVTFGRFPTDTDYEMKPLVWRVLSVEDDHALLMTEQEIMSISYDIIQKDAWENSYVRKLLNKGFFHAAFTEKEQAQIETVKLKNLKNPTQPGENRIDTKDRVFLLSFEEAETYLPTEESRTAKPTKYAFAQTAAKREWGVWNLRTEGKKPWGPVSVSEGLGEYVMTGNHVGRDYLRPCIRIKKI